MSIFYVLILTVQVFMLCEAKLPMLVHYSGDIWILDFLLVY